MRQMLRLAQAPLHDLQSDRQAVAGALNEIGGTGRDKRGQLRFLVWCANDHDGSVNGQGETTEFRRGIFPREPSLSGVAEGSSRRMTEGAASATMRRAA